jgi:type IV pilus assembly protein PilW
MRGLSLVEMMVALLLSVLIMAALVQVFTSTRMTYQHDEGLARLQENGRFAMDFLVRDIRGAGNMGCLGNIPSKRLSEYATNYLDSTDAPFDMSRGGIEGFEATGTGPGAAYTLPSMYPPPMVAATTPPLVGTILTQAARGSDVLVLREMSEDGVNLVAPYNDSAQIFAESGHFDNANDQRRIFIVTDCSRVSIFQATTVSNGGGKTNIAHGNGGDPGNICPVWGQGGCPGKSYKQGAQVAEFRVMAYYIGTGAGGGPALFRRTWSKGTPEDAELVENIENMQLLYGLNADSDSLRNADMYVPASGVTDWSQVVGVRVALLSASSNVRQNNASGATDTETDTGTYSINNVTIDPADDRRWRRVFTTTVELRNRHQ